MRALLLAFAAAAVGCHAQTPAAGLGAVGKEAGGARLSPELARRVEVMIRSRAEVGPDYVVTIGDRLKSEVPGYDEIDVTFSLEEKRSKPVPFLLSADGKTLAQFNKFDISQDPKLKVPAVDRPARGGGADAPVLVVGFDDLECPYCAKMHAALFPAILDRYKGQVRVVYLDFPLDQHPWAIRAAIDANCLATVSPSGYWNYVDYVHAHAADIGGEEKTIVKANESLDQLAMQEGDRQKANGTELTACLKKQDDTRLKASMKEGESLGVSGTPALFINGERVDGWTPLENIFRMIDGALTAVGQTPPPPMAPAAVTVPVAKPGN